MRGALRYVFGIVGGLLLAGTLLLASGADGTEGSSNVSVLAPTTEGTTIIGLARDGKAPPPPTATPPPPTATPVPATATPAPTAAPRRVGWPTNRRLTKAEMRSLALAGGFPAWAVPAALRVAWCESSWQPWRTGRAGERGLWQVHPLYHPDSTYDPLGNARAAVRISAGGRDWSQWTCQP